jgi:hypothetical protein
MLKREVTGSARGTQEKERGGMAWGTVRTEARFEFGVRIVWGIVMKTWLVMVALLLGVAGGARAQETAVARENDSSGAEALSETSLARASFTSLNSSHANDFFVAPELRLSFTQPASPEFAAINLAIPMASPAPVPKRHPASRVDDYRLQIGMGFTYLRFRSAAIHVGLYGLNTAVVYFLNPRIGLEGNFTGAFGPHIFNNNVDQTRYAGITGGPKITWRKEGWEPWAHGLVGLARVNPQLAGVSKNGVALEAGGGVDFSVLDGLFWLRVEGDYIRSQLYNTGQNNFQGVIGVVFHFF